MTRRAIVGHGRLLRMDPGRVGHTAGIDGPWLMVIDDGRIFDVRAGRLRPAEVDEVHDVGGALVTPGLVDPHTHLIYAGDRSDEAAARSRGEAYDGGGILRTVAATSSAGDAELVAATRARLRQAAALGTTTIEVKSGYGLSAEAELRLLHLIAQAADGLPLRVLRTFLGAHGVPAGRSADEQTEAVIAALPTVAPEADFIDAFCEPHLFDLAMTRRIAEAGLRHGLPLRLHADQLERSGGVGLGVELGALSVDHLEHSSPADARQLAASTTTATVLPGPALMLGRGLPPVRALLDAGACVAIGSDANAGTFGTPSMPLAIGLALALGLSIDQAVWAATAGAARALGLGGVIGSIRPGAAADVVAWDAEHEGALGLRLADVRPLATWHAGTMQARGSMTA